MQSGIRKKFLNKTLLDSDSKQLSLLLQGLIKGFRGSCGAAERAVASEVGHATLRRSACLFRAKNDRPKSLTNNR